MPIYWVGGEDIDFLFGAYPSFSTNASYSRLSAGWTRGAVYPATANTYLQSTAFAEQTSVWAGCQLYLIAGQEQVDNGLIFGLGKTGAGCRGIFVATGAVGTPCPLRIVKYDGTTRTTLATAAGSTFTYSALHKIDLQIISYGASATVNVYLNNNLAVTYTGDIRITDVNGFDCVQSQRYGYQAYNYREATPYISEVVVSSTDTRALSICTHYPTAAGDANGWTGAYTDVDETTLSDADLIYVNSNSQDCLFNMNNVPAGTYSVPAVKIGARMVKSADSAIANVKLGVKSGGTVDVGSNIAAPAGWGMVEEIKTTFNGAAITTTLLDAMQSALRSAT